MRKPPDASYGVPRVGVRRELELALSLEDRAVVYDALTGGLGPSVPIHLLVAAPTLGEEDVTNMRTQTEDLERELELVRKEEEARDNQIARNSEELEQRNEEVDTLEFDSDERREKQVRAMPAQCAAVGAQRARQCPPRNNPH
jgi:hypothetical protein